ncbi:MAG TPA: carbohydrate ABC transporter permease [Anaerolineaceae bacterium]|nr:carbohydrate ABC transporter permease [Anaerolineaceae bacterium]
MINGVLILICTIWIVPALGILITSFRDSQDIFRTGWWTVFPHQEYVVSGQIHVDPNTDLNGPIAIRGVPGKYTFEQLKEGVTLSDGRKLIWYGNKRTRLIEVSTLQWVGFSTRFTLKNYQDVLSDKTVNYKDANGNNIVRQGDNLSGAFLNSLAVTIPATVIPILIAAFAAFGFAWLKFRGRKFLFSIVVMLLVVPLQIALIPIVQDYTRLDLNGSFLGIWLAHTGFGLPLAVYLLFNYISQLPREILESAYIDGASNFTIFTQLILPLSVPALASFAIFQFMWVWNDYLVALVFLGNHHTVLTVALANMVGEKGQDWHLLTAGAFISMIMPMTVFFALQRYFVRGMTAGSVKG